MLFQILVLTIVLITLKLSDQSKCPFHLKVGDYWKPDDSETSGVPKNKKDFHRAPCPGLNALANHGYIPRDGKKLSVWGIMKGLKKVYGIPFRVGVILATQLLITNKLLFKPFTLADYGIHNGVEHDGSLFHYDHYYGKDPYAIDKEALADFIKLSKDGKTITIDDVAEHRKARYWLSKTKNPEYSWRKDQKSSLGFEAGLFIEVLGRDGKISVDYVKSFIEDGKIPSDYVRWPRDPSIKLSKSGLYILNKAGISLKEEKAPKVK